MFYITLFTRQPSIFISKLLYLENKGNIEISAIAFKKQTPIHMLDA